MHITDGLSKSALAIERVDFPAVIESIGEQRFGVQLLAFLHDTCGAEHATVFHLRGDEIFEISAASIDGTDTAHHQTSLYIERQLWRVDPTLREARERLDDQGIALIRTDIVHLSDRNLREIVYGTTNIRDRVFVCARSDDGIIGLSVLRSQQAGSFSGPELSRVEAIAETLFAVLAKHISISLDRPDVSGALTTLHDIEACIAGAKENLPRREAEVCSRIIYGVFSIGIAMELGISQETVMTYRKRAYQRLGIATQRELLLWYLSTWSRWREQRHSVQ